MISYTPDSEMEAREVKATCPWPLSWEVGSWDLTQTRSESPLSMGSCSCLIARPLPCTEVPLKRTKTGPPAFRLLPSGLQTSREEDSVPGPQPACWARCQALRAGSLHSGVPCSSHPGAAGPETPSVSIPSHCSSQSSSLEGCCAEQRPQGLGRQFPSKPPGSRLPEGSWEGK